MSPKFFGGSSYWYISISQAGGLSRLLGNIQRSPRRMPDSPEIKEFPLISVRTSNVVPDLGLAIRHTETSAEEGSKEVRTRESIRAPGKHEAEGM